MVLKVFYSKKTTKNVNTSFTVKSYVFVTLNYFVFSPKIEILVVT